jgi:catechol 2,3-dioxygenase-like lactoylglutathione lyase family enzyme
LNKRESGGGSWAGVLEGSPNPARSLWWSTCVPRDEEGAAVIFGAHVILFSHDAEADRAFLADVLGFPSVDAGGGWLIFALPPAEAAVHPSEDAPSCDLYFMCDDLAAEIAALTGKGVTCSPVEEPRWGRVTRIRLPGGGEVGLYQPSHPLAVPPAP